MSMTNRATYSALSRDTHTGLRINTSISFENLPSGIKISILERDNELNLKTASTSAMLSVSEMLMSLEYRKNLHLH